MIPREEKYADFGNHLQFGNPLSYCFAFWELKGRETD